MKASLPTLRVGKGAFTDFGFGEGQVPLERDLPFMAAPTRSHLRRASEGDSKGPLLPSPPFRTLPL